MASQLQFEGPVLEDLLERVRAEVGPNARIVAANRVRKGGVGGFFARQAYEVLVEPVDSTTAATGTATAATPPPSRAANGQPVYAEPDARVAATILELADLVSEHERNDVIDLVEERRVSTESHEFAQVLDRFSQAIDTTPDELPGEVPPPLDAARAGEIDLRDEVSTAPSTRPATAVPPLPNEPTGPARHPSADDFDPNALATPHLDERAPIDPEPARSRRRSTATPAPVIDRYETRLSKMGLPARLIPRGVNQHDLKGALVESLTRLPPAPGVPSGLGVVIAVVGTGSAPVLHARELASELALDPDDVVLATREHLAGGIPAWLQMGDPGTAQERRRSWSRRARPTIVACSMPRNSGLRWAREMLDNLEPTITWAIVDASSKREDIAHRIDALGGVDALAIDGLDDTVSPAATLELGIPVGRLEQEHASPLTWTELLLERLSS